MNFDFELSRADCTFYLYDCTGRAFALPLASVLEVAASAKF